VLTRQIYSRALHAPVLAPPTVITMAQVPIPFGAGEEKRAGPAPLERMRDGFVAQVPHQKTHLRQE